MRFFLDASVPVSVGRVFRDRGHEVIEYSEALAEGESDIVVCQTALKNDAVLVAVDKDMKQLVRRFGAKGERFKDLSLLFFGCHGPMASKRAEQFASLIEHEWEHTAAKQSRRLFVEIGNHDATSHR